MSLYANPFDTSNGSFDAWNNYLNKLNPNRNSDATQRGSAQYELDKPENARLAYSAFNAITGYGQTPAFSNWMNQHENKYKSLYDAASYKDAATYNSWTNFLTQFNPAQDYNMSSPFERGERPATFNPTMSMRR